MGTFWPLITHLLIKWEPAWLGLSSSVKWYIYCILQLQAEILRSHRLAKVTQAYFFIYLWINHAYHERFTPNCLFGARKNPFMIYTFFPCKCNWKSIDFCDIYNFPNDCISLGIWFLGVIYLLQKEQKTSKLYFRFSQFSFQKDYGWTTWNIKHAAKLSSNKISIPRSSDWDKVVLLTEQRSKRNLDKYTAPHKSKSSGNGWKP